MDQPITMVHHPLQFSLGQSLRWPVILTTSVLGLFLAEPIPAQTPPLPPADLEFSLDDAPDPVVPGGLLIYTLTASNLGPDPATDVRADMGLPFRTTFCAADPRCTANEQFGFLECQPGALGVDESVDLPITFMVDTGAAGTIPADVSGFDIGTSDPISGNNIDTAITTVNGGDVFGVVIEPATVNVAPNSTQTFTAFGCPVADTTSTPLVGSDGTPGTDDDECVPAAVEWAASSGIGMVSPSAGPTTTLTAGPNFATGAVIANACLFSAFASITIAPPVLTDLEVTKDDTPDPVPVGADLTYSIVVSNNGPDNATNVKLFDQLPVDIPAPVTFVSATINPPAQRTCAFALLPPGIPTVGCDLGTMAANTSVLVTIVVTVTPDADGSFVNSVEVFADQPDPDLQNNAAEVLTTVLACQGRVPTIIGTNDPDFLVGTLGPDVIHGLGGNDIIFGSGGDDMICGGPGDDIILGNAGDDTLLGQLGSDRIFGGTGEDILNGGIGVDILVGGEHDDTLNGGPGNDFMVGGEDDDTLNGGPGRDTLLGEAGNDILRGQEDGDFLFGDENDDTLNGGAGRDSCNGGDGTDKFEETVPGDQGGCELISNIP
ncbi:MAG: hypothetical protein AB7G75_26270 [Candidatus Binatia bacterium]